MQCFNANSLLELSNQRDLKEEKSVNISHLKSIKSYKGLRHSLRFPVRGQRTRSNAKTVKLIRI